MRNEPLFPNIACTGSAPVSQFLHQQLTAAAAALLVGLLSLGATPASCEQVAVVDSDAHYPEGPLWRDGKLLFVEYSAGNIKSWNGVVSSVIWHEENCGPSGLITRGDNLLVACYDGNFLEEIDASGKRVRALHTDSQGRPFIGPNDFAADDHGGIYFSASGAYDVKAPASGEILYLRPDGEITRLESGIHYPNGLTVTKDRRHLLVAEMLEGRLVSFQIESNGALSSRRVWARLQDLLPPTPKADAYNGPDGLKLGPDGNYYIAQNGSGRLLVVSDDKKVVRVITVPAPYVTNVAFDPLDKNVVFITGAFEQWKPPFPGTVYRWTR